MFRVYHLKGEGGVLEANLIHVHMMLFSSCIGTAFNNTLKNYSLFSFQIALIFGPSQHPLKIC